jgi:hypothetical protein
MNYFNLCEDMLSMDALPIILNHLRSQYILKLRIEFKVYLQHPHFHLKLSRCANKDLFQVQVD